MEYFKVFNVPEEFFCFQVTKELQSLVYLKVKQTAFVQVAVMTFAHVHTLSLDWHLRKKMGQVSVHWWFALECGECVRV